jgi:hypothetical protein
MANVATSTIFYRKTAWTWVPEVQTLATLKTDLWLTGTNSWDQTSIVWITGTKAQFDTAVTDGNFLYVWDITQYTNELAQDAIWAMLDSSLTYVDGTPLLQRSALTWAITASAGSNTTSLGSFTTAQLNTALSDNDVATLAWSETFTNKTLTSPILTTPVLWTPASWNLDNCTADWTDKVWFRNIPSNSKSTAYTAVLSDAGKSIDHPSTDANARTFTIPDNSSVAYPIGTALSFSNMTSQVVTIAITTDTMYLAWTGTTGSRTLAQYWVATARKLTSTTWLISWIGLT